MRKFCVNCTHTAVNLALVAATLAAQQSPETTPVKSDPLELHFQAAQTFQLADDLPHAAEEYRKAISMGLQRLGNLRSSEQKSSEAVALLTTATQLDPSNTDAVIDLAVAHFYAGDIAKARSIVEP